MTLVRHSFLTRFGKLSRGRPAEHVVKWILLDLLKVLLPIEVL